MPATSWRTKIQPEPDRPYTVMATLLPLRSHRTVPQFMALTLTVVRQLERSPGLVAYALDAELVRKTFWTLSAWDSIRSLRRFSNALPHARVIQELRGRMGATAFVTWEVAGADLPVSWQDARRRIDVSESRTAASRPRGA